HVHILPTSDYDGNLDRGGLARCATQIRRWQRENHNSILIDVGDVYQGTDVSLRNKGGLMIDLLNHLEYDAWVIGNHAFDWGMEGLEGPLENSNRQFLAATRLLKGKPAADFQKGSNRFAKIQPLIWKIFVDT